jgi:selT/selW/selH-like putative selenoprotein
MPQATSLVTDLKRHFGDRNIEPEFEGGKGGIFDVTVDGKRVFSKHQMNRFPESREIIEAIEKL